MTMKFSVWLFFLLPLVSTQSTISSITKNQTDNKYLYVIYYDDSNCQEAVAIEGFVLGEEQDLYKGNSDDRYATCAQEVICQIDETSKQCKNLNDSGLRGKTTFTRLENGTIHQLDNTNPEDDRDTNLSKDECYSSSVHRHCHFKVASLSDIISNNLKLIQNDELLGNKSNDNNNLNDQLYLLFYNDENCNDLAGIDGFVAGHPKKLSTTRLTISAYDAVACAYNPGGDVCNIVVVPNGEISFSGDVLPASDDSGDNYNNVVWYTKNIHSEEICEVIPPDACLTSDFHDCNGCSFKVVSGLDLFANPNEIIKSSYSQPYDFVSCPENNMAHDDNNGMTLIIVVVVCSIVFVIFALFIGYLCYRIPQQGQVVAIDVQTDVSPITDSNNEGATTASGLVPAVPYHGDRPAGMPEAVAQN